MPLLNRIAELQHEIAAWRRDFHQNPEVLYDLPRTAGVVAERLRSFGFDEVATGIGVSGVVGVLHGRKGPGGASVALRADMDALPITEITGKAWASTTPGRMHACGHDGHMAMLLGAARHLAETRAFDGTLVFIFQPAEEGGGGARAMIEDGLFDRFPIDAIYGLHNLPGLPIDHFGLRSGAIMAAADRVTIEIEGRGGHAALPHLVIDPVLAGAHIVTALQSIVARNVDPLKAAVVSISCFKAGTTDNVIPETATLSGTVRALDETVREEIEARITAMVPNLASVFGAKAKVIYKRGYPVTVNEAKAASFAAEIARRVAGGNAVDDNIPPLMAAEDFSYYLEKKPGAFVFIGNGPSAGLHSPAYDFDDAAIPYGVSWWVDLAEAALQERASRAE